MNLEICTNNEWWRVFGPLDFDGIEDCFENEAGDDFVNDYWAALEAAGFVVGRPCGRRASCHGWNGANTFQRSGFGVGTFDEGTTDLEWEAIGEIFDATQTSWHEKWADTAAPHK